jgi:hypothetical protein
MGKRCHNLYTTAFKEQSRGKEHPTSHQRYIKSDKGLTRNAFVMLMCVHVRACVCAYV